MQLRTVYGVSQIIELSVRHCNEVIRFLITLAKDLDQRLSHLNVGKLVLSSDIINVPSLALVKDAVECTCHVLDVKEVTGVGSISMNSHRHATQQLVSKFGNQLLGILVRSVYVVASGDDHRKLERAMVRLHQELSSCLGGGVWVCRLQDVFFIHGVGIKVFTFSIYLICRDMNESADGGAVLGRLEQNVCAIDVGLGEGEGVTKGVIYMGLCCKVHDSVDIILLKAVVYKVITANITFHKLEVGEIFYFVEVLYAGAVVELVIDNNIVLRVFLTQ